MAWVFSTEGHEDAPASGLLARVLGALPDEWIVLCHWRFAPGGSAIDAVLVHPALGVALIDEAPSDARPSVAALRERLARERFAEFFPGELPIVTLSFAVDPTASTEPPLEFLVKAF